MEAEELRLAILVTSMDGLHQLSHLVRDLIDHYGGRMEVNNLARTMDHLEAAQNELSEALAITEGRNN